MSCCIRRGNGNAGCAWLRAIDTADAAPEYHIIKQEDYIKIIKKLNYEAQAKAGIVLVARQISSSKAPALR